MKDLIKNRKASHEYEILESFVAGMILYGWEVKSILAGNCSIAEGFIDFADGVICLKQAHIAKYKNIDQFTDSNEVRDRKLLLNKSEIRKIKKKIAEKGLTAIPLNVFYSDTKKIKLTIAIGRGKKLHDKREDLRKKQHQREISRESRE